MKDLVITLINMRTMKKMKMIIDNNNNVANSENDDIDNNE